MNYAAHDYNVKLQPQFIPGQKGRFFSLFVPPKDVDTCIFLFLPSFGEEMNRCRVMVSLQARNFAAQGHGCLLIDYYGTVDSEGEFEDTTWDIWYEDALSAYHWLRQHCNNRVVLWGVRIGALLATELAYREAQYFSRLLLWQPISDANLFLTQFFRIRLAMQMDRGEAKETTQQMRHNLKQGNSIEIAGYTVTPELVESIETKKISNYDKLPLPVDWFEVVMDINDGLTPASQKQIEIWQQHNVVVNSHCYQGPAFWQLHERELTPDLIKKTTALFL